LSQGKQTSWTSLLKASLCNVVAVEKRTGGGFLSMPKISVKMQQFESNPGFLAHLLNEGVGAKHKLWH
jgi:hypothetical protein